MAGISLVGLATTARAFATNSIADLCGQIVPIRIECVGFLPYLIELDKRWIRKAVHRITESNSRDTVWMKMCFIARSPLLSAVERPVRTS